MKKILFLSTLSLFSFLANAQKIESSPIQAATQSKVSSVKQKEQMSGIVIADETKMVQTKVAPITFEGKLEETLAVKEIEFNFGKIPQGKPVTHIFVISNTGKTAFKLDNVAASCGCTTPVWDKEKVIGAGTTAEITVGYNAAAEGAFTKPVTITYNGTQSKVITIKGEVWKTPATSAPINAEVNDLKN